MEEAAKKLLYAGIGLATTVTENFNKTLEELVEKGKVSDSEAKKLVEEFLEKTETRKDEFDERWNNLVEKLGYTSNSEVEELRQRVEELEAQLGKKSTSKKATAAS